MKPILNFNKVNFTELLAYLQECFEIIQSDVIKSMSCASIFWNTFNQRASLFDKQRMESWKPLMVQVFDNALDESNTIQDFILKILENNPDKGLIEYWLGESGSILLSVHEAHDYSKASKLLSSQKEKVKEPKEEYVAPKPIVNAKTNDVQGLINKAQAIKAKQKKK